ncbi:MAG: hypothetical protein WDW38_008534 [Sanguina aurantia]
MAPLHVVVLLSLLSLGGTERLHTAGDRDGKGVGAVRHPTSERKHALDQSASISLRCAMTVGGWCRDFLEQTKIKWLAPPRGDTPCPNNCSSIGRCNYDIGYCDCPVGTTGEDCSTHQKRPCAKSQRHVGSNPEEMAQPLSHIGPDMRDLDTSAYGNMYSRCAARWCILIHLLIQSSLSLSLNCQRVSAAHVPVPKVFATWSGQKSWGERTRDEVYGERGWCNSSTPVFNMPCIIDGLAGDLCDEPIEHMCPGQCSGQGVCNLGFCNCDPGYYGHDCARPRASVKPKPSRILTQPWLATAVIVPPASLDPPPATLRKRPLIYVYDLEPLFQSKMLQMRINGWADWPWFHLPGGSPAAGASAPQVPERHLQRAGVQLSEEPDTLLHESLLLSEHRTFDPEEADFFYVPHMATCHAFPINGWADWPWFHLPGGGCWEMLRSQELHSASLPQTAPGSCTSPTSSWTPSAGSRSGTRSGTGGGRDHVWLFTHDEGACWVPNEVTPSVWLTHWGRMGPHTSNSAFLADDYNHDVIHPTLLPKGWHATTNITGHVCYDPVKDLVVPSVKVPGHYQHSALQGHPAKPRDKLFYFRGDVGKHRLTHYSRGVRQSIYKMAIDGGWGKTHGVWIGDSSDVPGDYSEHLATSIFCLVAAGDGWSGRAEDAMLHGCIPVNIQDGVHTVFQSILNYSSYGVTVAEKDVKDIVQILKAIPERQVHSMQAHIGRVWHRFRWATTPLLESELRRRLGEHAPILADGTDHEPITPLYPLPFRGDPTMDDAFDTVLQFLHSRINATR